MELRYDDFINSDIKSLLGENLQNSAYQLTQYVKYGCATIEDLHDYLYNLYCEEPIEMGDYNDWCDFNGYRDDYIYINDEELLENSFSSKSEAVRSALYGNYNISDEYVTFDGYMNLVSSDYLEDIENNSDCISNWIDELLENNEDEASEIIEACNELIKKGY